MLLPPGEDYENYSQLKDWQGPVGPIQTRTAAAYKADGITERVVVPGLVAAIVGVASGLLSGLLIGAFKIQLPVLYVMPIVTLLVFLLVFWASTQRGQWLIERISGADLNGDGFIGQPVVLPPAQPQSTRIELIQDDGNQGDYLDFGISPEKLKAVALAVVNQKRQFSLRSFNGTPVNLKDSEFEAVRAELIERGLATWRDENQPRQGVVLTPAGRGLMRYLASERYQPK